MSAAEEKIAVLEHDRQSLRDWFSQQGLPAYRADQVLKWVWQRARGEFEKMTDLPKDLRGWLAERLEVFRSRIVEHRKAPDGTRKLLLAWRDGQTCECVLIPDRDRRTACLSTQVGCPVGCAFCASGLNGLKRNLTVGEICEQLLRLHQAASGNRITHVVFMGMGEPLANYDATVAAIRAINAKWGYGLGARRITVSTVGIPSRIRDLAEEGLQVNLAISLHAPTDALRRQIVPWAAKYRIAEILDAARYYFERTGRQITLEYVLLAGINDHMTQAQQLIKLAKSLPCSVNLIRYNPVPGLPYKRPTSQRAYEFQQALKKAKVPAKIRKSRGLDADAACGQLRIRQGQAAAAN